MDNQFSIKKLESKNHIREHPNQHFFTDNIQYNQQIFRSTTIFNALNTSMYGLVLCKMDHCLNVNMSNTYRIKKKKKMQWK